jgi:hypothetical protein
VEPTQDFIGKCCGRLKLGQRETEEHKRKNQRETEREQASKSNDYNLMGTTYKLLQAKYN